MRTKILVSLMIAGVAAAAATGSTFALFNDTETSQQNTFAAGSVDLLIDWNQSYNGEDLPDQDATDNPGPIFQLDDVKPGDEGEATISLHNEGNPAWLWFKLNVTSNDDNGNTEPELIVDELDNESDNFDGELYQNLNFTIWYDDGDNIRQDDEPLIETEEVCRLVDRDVVLTLDNSGSMFYDQYNGDPNNDGVPKFDDQKSAALNFVNQAFQPGNDIHVGSSRFGGQDDPSSVLINTTGNQTEVVNAINGLQPVDEDDTGTDLAGGVDLSHDMLINNSRPGTDDVMIVLSDGQQATISGDPVAEAQEAKDDGIRVITITLNPPNQQLVQTMEQMASSPSDAYVVEQSQDLPDVYNTISEEICTTITPFEDGMLIDGNLSEEGVQPIPGQDVDYLGFKWELPREVGNIVQTDTAQLDMNFYAEQSRHNDNPSNPFNN